MAQAKGNPKSSFNDENLSMVTSDLFVAGMVSTSTTLTWALLLMILHPDVQHEPTLGARWAGRGRRGTGWGLLNMICNTPHPRPTEALSRGWALVGGRSCLFVGTAFLRSQAEVGAQTPWGSDCCGGACLSRTCPTGDR